MRDTEQSGNGPGPRLSREIQPGNGQDGQPSTTVQYESKLGDGDLNLALALIVSRACAITRGTGAAVALGHESGITCRAVAGDTAPPVGAQVNLNSGLSGECLRLAKPLRCDNTETDPRVDAEACRQIGIRSIVAAPILCEREVVGLLEVFSTGAYAFDNGDLAVVERLAQTIVVTLGRVEAGAR